MHQCSRSGQNGTTVQVVPETDDTSHSTQTEDNPKALFIILLIEKNHVNITVDNQCFFILHLMNIGCSLDRSCLAHKALKISEQFSFCVCVC